MAFTINSSIIEITGDETIATFSTWAISNTIAATSFDINNVEALYQIKVQDGATFDTSLGCLTINHRLEGQTTGTTATGLWINHGGSVIQQGAANQYSEYWCPSDFDRAHWISNKTGAKHSFFRSTNTPTTQSMINSTFISNALVIDQHLNFDGELRDCYFESKTGGVNFFLLKGQSTDGISLIGIDLGGWAAKGSGDDFHKNMTFYHGVTDLNSIVFYYRRVNDTVYYNARNGFNGERMTTISNKTLGGAGGNGRAIIVGKFEPVLESSLGVALDGVLLEIRNVGTDVVEHDAVTASDGKADTSGVKTSWSWEGRTVSEDGTLYVKQSIVPITTGAIDSVDQGTFRIRMRRRDLQFFESIQAFTFDFDGVKIVQSDVLYTAGVLDFPSVTSIDTSIELYNYYKYFGEINIDNDILITRSASEIDLGNYNLVIDAAAGVAFAFDGTTITIKSSIFAGDLTTTGIVTDSGGPRTLNYGVTGTLDLTTAGTYTLDGKSVGNVTNSSGGNILLNLINGATATTAVAGTGAGQVDIRQPFVMSITGQPVGSTVVVYDDDSADPQELGTELERFDPASATETFTYDVTALPNSVAIVMIEGGYRYYLRTVDLLSADFTYTITPELETN